MGGAAERQEEIDASIARNAETEYLYDRPYEEKGKVRVTGPFTVESLSPHRVLPADEETRPGRSCCVRGGRGRARAAAAAQAPSRRDGKRATARTISSGSCSRTSKAAGVQNTKKGERLASRA